MKLDWTPERRERAKAMRQNGASWEDLGRSFGVDAGTVRRRLDPEWAARRLALDTKSRRERGDLKTAAAYRLGLSDLRSTAEMGMRLKREIPPDTRDLTGRMLGDPLPARSALAAKYGYSAGLGK